MVMRVRRTLAALAPLANAGPRTADSAQGSFTPAGEGCLEPFIIVPRQSAGKDTAVGRRTTECDPKVLDRMDIRAFSIIIRQAYIAEPFWGGE
jgi:hypothetical protein